MADNALIALLLGVLEGLTEFIPVSSTGHLLLAGHFLGFDAAGKTFEVVIQLGAIFALLFVYAQRLWAVFTAAPHDPAARRFIGSVLLAFLPAAVLGVLLHDIIKTVLFETPMLIATMLVIGGVILLFFERFAPEPTVDDAEALPLRKAFYIGLCQCLAMVPGVSRSGATIVGAVMLGVSKRAAAEFSFFLSMPTMAGAVAYDIYATRHELDLSAWGEIAIGFGAAFVTALLVVHWLLGFVSRHGYALFGWWRIAVGGVALVALLAGR
ncbi:undecaprenyl-diphosphate phosphatase [Pseudoroseicyclus sp. H15]